ncbi:MAG: hypothetical protein HUJ67_01410 [Ruminiclostridium sp.]|nr:hypothetical protein [Ruminiclostridium sp.]
MARIIVNMQNYVQSEAIELALKSGGDFHVCPVESPKQVAEACKLFAANIVLMEVTGYTPWKFDERMKIRDEIREKDPRVKIILLVDEKAEKQAAEQVKQAKRDGLIDQFIYGSTSASYLVALLDTL